MIIYHGSTVPIEIPKILQSERMLDFGKGFYTTSNKNQAISWAQNVAVRRKTSDQILSIYEFDAETAKKNLSIIYFDEPNETWLDFVCENRNGRRISQSYDMVFGPVADDKVYTVVQLYENGIYDKEDAIKRLKIENLYNQILFHTEKSLMYCRFIKYESFQGERNGQR